MSPLPQKLILHDFHSVCDAKFILKKNWLIPQEYGNINRELQFLKNSVGLLDRSYLGKVILEGADAVDFINRISTNDMTKLMLSPVCDTLFITPKGRLVDYCRVIRLKKHFLLISSYVECTHLIDWLNRFLILEEVEIKEASADYLWFTLIGPHSLEFIRALDTQNIHSDDEYVWINQGDMGFAALLNNNFVVPAYNFCLPAANSFSILTSLRQKLIEFDGGLIGDTAFQIMRVESGMPDWGSELTEDYNPHEARLLTAVSFTKGCYTGQEVVARLDTYDKIQKYLMIIEMQEVIENTPPFDVLLDDEKIGILTSYAHDPLTRRSIGLGYIKKNYTLDDFNLEVEVLVDDRRIRAFLRLPPLLKK